MRLKRHQAVRSSRMCQRCSHWTYLYEIWYWGLWKSVEKFQICLYQSKMSDTLPEDRRTFYFCRRR